MKPMTSRTATGSFMPASPSSARATRRRRRDPRSTAKIAAPSVDETIAPMSIPSSSDMSNSHVAARPVMSAVPNVPSTAMLIEAPSTGRISSKPLASPPSKRMSASATIPTVRASS
jgi:hypothetical protein